MHDYGRVIAVQGHTRSACTICQLLQCLHINHRIGGKAVCIRVRAVEVGLSMRGQSAAVRAYGERWRRLRGESEAQNVLLVPMKGSQALCIRCSLARKLDTGTDIHVNVATVLSYDTRVDRHLE